MRNARNLERTLYYALQGDEIPVYELDDDGNVKYYYDADGSKIALTTGETTIGYSKPVEMKASVSFGSGEVEAQEYGLSVSDYDASLVTTIGTYPIEETSLIWLFSEIKYIDAEENTVNSESADYKVVAIKPSKFYTKILIKKLTK